MANPTSRILWWALVASLVLYAVVAHVVDLPVNPNTEISLLLPVFIFLSASTGVGTLLYRRRALSGPIQSRRLDPSTPEGLRAAFQPFIMNLVLSESIGIYGLVLAFLSGQPFYAVAFSAAALVLMYLHRPTAPDLVAPLSGHQAGRDFTPIG